MLTFTLTGKKSLPKYLWDFEEVHELFFINLFIYNNEKLSLNTFTYQLSNTSGTVILY